MVKNRKTFRKTYYNDCFFRLCNLEQYIRSRVVVSAQRQTISVFYYYIIAWFIVLCANLVMVFS